MPNQPSRFWAWLSAAIEPAHLRWIIIRPAVLSFTCATVFALVLGLTHAGREVLYHMAEGLSFGKGFSLPALLRFIYGLSAATLFAFLVWYTSRAVLYVAYEPIKQALGQHRARIGDKFLANVGERWRKWAPRLMGLVPLIPAVAVYAIDWWRSPGGSNPQRLDNIQSGMATIAFLGAMIGLAAFVAYRGSLPSWLGGQLAKERHRELVSELPARTRWMARGFLALVLVCVVAFSFSKTSLPHALGTAGVAFLFASCLVVVGAFLLAYPVNRLPRLSIPVVCLALALIAGWFAAFGWTDNHAVRLAAADQREAEQNRIANRPVLEKWLAGWLRSRSGLAARPEAPYPLVVASAQGGGVRAAMWTAAGLGALQDRDTAFACHLFAVSGISGGALGALVFEALLETYGTADCTAQRTQAENIRKNTVPENEERLTSAAFSLFRTDFLASITAGALFPDLVARIWPFATAGVSVLVPPDRQRYLEAALVDAWAATPERRKALDLDQPFLEVAAGEGRADPLLLLTASEVQTGRRWIASEVAITSGEPVFADAVDALMPDGRRMLPMPASVVAGNSARFPWVSPPGGIHFPGEHWSSTASHLLDGGIVESSGAATSFEVLSFLRRQCAVLSDDRLGCKPIDDTVTDCRPGVRGCLFLRPVSLQLTNDGYDDAPAAGGFGLGALMPRFPELLDPISALLSSRTGRGHEAHDRLLKRPGFGGVAPITLELQLERTGESRPDKRVPLTWTVMHQTEKVMRDSLDNVFSSPAVRDELAHAFEVPAGGFSEPVRILPDEREPIVVVDPDGGSVSITPADFALDPPDIAGQQVERHVAFWVSAGARPDNRPLSVVVKGQASTHDGVLTVMVEGVEHWLELPGRPDLPPFEFRRQLPAPIDGKLDMSIAISLVGSGMLPASRLTVDTIDLSLDEPAS